MTVDRFLMNIQRVVEIRFFEILAHSRISNSDSKSALMRISKHSKRDTVTITQNRHVETFHIEA